MARSKEREIARAKRLYADLLARGDVAPDEAYIEENPWLTDPKDAREAGEAVGLLQWIEANRQLITEREWYWSEGLITVKDGVLYERSGTTRVIRLTSYGVVEVADSAEGPFAPYGSFKVLVRQPFTVIVTTGGRPDHEWRMHVERPSISMNWSVETMASDLSRMGRTDVALAPSYTEQQIVEMVTKFLSTEPAPTVEAVRAFERELRATWRMDHLRPSPSKRVYVYGPYVEGVVYTQWLSVRLANGALRVQ
ncbi:MAG: hypothetical protein WD716_13085 [Fimbriimonadaceae bacterium]